MSYQVRIMGSAQADIHEVYRYIATDLQNPDAAVRRIEAIEASIKSLKEMPAGFPLVSDGYLASKGVRMVVVKSHLVFFVIRDEVKKVSIMRVLYARRDWVRILGADVGRLGDSL